MEGFNSILSLDKERIREVEDKTVEISGRKHGEIKNMENMEQIIR